MSTCEEDTYPEGKGFSMFKSLPEFVNTFGSKFDTTCILCRGKKLQSDSTNQDCLINKELSNNELSLKDVCVRSVVDDVLPLPKGTENVSVDQSYPFCKDCTPSVSKLNSLCKQLEEIHEEFTFVRGQIVQKVITRYIELDQCLKNIDEEEMFGYWEKKTHGNILSLFHNSHHSGSLLNEPLHQFYNEDFNPLEIKEEYEGPEEDEMDEDEEPEEFINPHSLIEDTYQNPVVRLGKPVELDEIKLKTSRIKSFSPKEEGYDGSESDSELAEGRKIEDDDDEYRPETDEENEYVPPRKSIEDQVYRRVTRRSSKITPTEVTATVTKELCDDIDNDTENSTDSTETLIPKKRKYTRKNTRITSENNKKRKKETTTDTTNKGSPLKAETDKTDEQSSSQAPKPKKKRIKKRIPTPCKICGKVLSQAYTLTVHMRTHTGEKPYKCTLCPMRFYKSSNRNAHMFRHTKETKHTCEICGMKFSEKAFLRHHKASRHEIYEAEIVYQCECCLKKFIRKSDWKYHVEKAICSNKGHQYRNTCFLCNIEFDNQENLLEHRKSEEHINTWKSGKRQQKKRKRKRKASKVNTNPPKKGSKLEEKEEKTEITVKGQCKDCGEKFPTTNDLKKHRRRVHNCREYVCEVCGKVVTSMGNLTKHKTVHHGQVKPFGCTICGERFNANVSLKYHLTKHTGEKLFKCENCPSSFNESRYLRRHLVETHPDVYLKEKSHFCKSCFLNFTSEEEVSEHFKSHDGLICSFCNRVFGTKKHLSRHILIHTGERPYKCNYCDKTFTQDSNLKEHIYRHTGERPFRCSYCNAGFLRRKEMKNHIDKHHPDEVAESEKQNPIVQPVSEASI